MKQDYNELIQTTLDFGAWITTKFISEKEIVRVTRTLYRKKILKRGNVELTVTIGKPNYAEREYIKLCKKAGVKFPIRKTWFRYPPKKRK